MLHQCHCYHFGRRFEREIVCAKCLPCYRYLSLLSASDWRCSLSSAWFLSVFRDNSVKTELSINIGSMLHFSSVTQFRCSEVATHWEGIVSIFAN